MYKRLSGLFNRGHKPELKLRPLRNQIARLLGIFIITSVLLAFWSAGSYTAVQKKNMNDYLEMYTSHMAQATSQAYASYENIAYSIAYNSSVQNYMQQKDSVQRYRAYQDVYSLLANTAKLNSCITDIAVLSNDGNSISLCVSPKIYDCFADKLKASSDVFISLGTLSVNGTECHILAMPIHQLTISGNSRYLGTAIIAINSRRFFYSDIKVSGVENPVILLADSSKSLIYGNSELFEVVSSKGDDLSEDIVIDHISYALRAYTISDMNNRLYVLIDTSPYTNAARRVLMQLLCGIIAIAGLLLMSFLRALYPLSRSLGSLTKVMNDISDGSRQLLKDGIDTTNVSYGCSEILDIYTAFNAMISEINKLNHTVFNTYTRMYELEMNNRQTEIDFLRSQINPHFLYNTLASICGLSADGKTDEIIDVTSSLSRIFRYSVQGEDIVPLSDEMDIVRSYLMIQSCRFENKFTARFEIDDKALSIMIPKMIIQPLVENAIVHGIEPCMEHGIITISARFLSEQQLLAITVSDTGVGVPEEKLASLQATLKESIRNKSGNAREDLQAMDRSHHDSIGILNVNSRIVLYYGEAYALTLSSEYHTGTRVTITIPCSSDQHTEKGDFNVPGCNY